MAKRIRQLEKQLKYYEKQPTSEPAKDEEVIPPTPTRDPCNACGKGFIDLFEFMDRVIGTCDTCADRKRIK